MCEKNKCSEDCKDCLKRFFVKNLPEEPCKNALYFVKTQNGIDVYVTDILGQPTLITTTDSQGDVNIMSSGSITIEQVGQDFNINVSQVLQDLINSAVQPEDISLQAAWEGGSIINAGNGNIAGFFIGTGDDTLSQISSSYSDGTILTKSDLTLRPTETSLSNAYEDSDTPENNESGRIGAENGNAYMAHNFSIGETLYDARLNFPNLFIGQENIPISVNGNFADDQGNIVLESSGIQAGDNVSLLTNDADYQIGSDIPDDIFISTTVDGKYITYLTDSYRQLDLQQFTNINIINTNEIVKIKNDIFITGNFSEIESDLSCLIALYDCKIINNFLIVGSYNSRVLTSSTIHGLTVHRSFLYLTNRKALTTIFKINPYDLLDVKSLSMPDTLDFNGATSDIVGYKDKVYIVLNSGTTGQNTSTKVIEISEDLQSYKLLVKNPSPDNFFHAIQGGNPFIIYNEEIYILYYRSFSAFSIRVYDLLGTFKRQAEIVSNLSTGALSMVAHWITVFSNKLIITTTYKKALFRLNPLTLAKEENIALPIGVTDDNTITKDGYIYLNGETNPFETPPPLPQLIKVKYNNFSNLTVEISNYNNSKGSYGSINNITDKEILKTKLTQFQNDLVTVPAQTNALITADVTGKSIITKEYFTANIPIVSPTNIGYTPSTRELTSSTGTGFTFPLADATNAGLLTSAEKTLIGTITSKENAVNKQNSLAVDATNLKYPTVTAVNTGLDLKANDLNVIHKTGSLNESVNGQKTFVDLTTFYGIQFIPDADMRFGNDFSWKYDSALLGMNLVKYGFADGLIFVKNSNGFVGIRNTNPTEQLDVVGNFKASGTAQIANATAPNHAVALGQIPLEINKKINGGIASFTGDNLTTMFSIPHGLTGIPIPMVTRRSDEDGNLFQADADATNINVTFVGGIPMIGNVTEVNWVAFLV